jgi:predicted polyphosphate/ATP-dependent NAD kinase
LPNSQILIFSTLEKIRNTQFLYVDTGDPELDKKLQGYFPIITGYHEEIMRKIL